MCLAHAKPCAAATERCNVTAAATQPAGGAREDDGRAEDVQVLHWCLRLVQCGVQCESIRPPCAPHSPNALAAVDADECEAWRQCTDAEPGGCSRVLLQLVFEACFACAKQTSVKSYMSTVQLKHSMYTAARFIRRGPLGLPPPCSSLPTQSSGSLRYGFQ